MIRRREWAASNVLCMAGFEGLASLPVSLRFALSFRTPAHTSLPEADQLILSLVSTHYDVRLVGTITQLLGLVNALQSVLLH